MPQCCTFAACQDLCECLSALPETSHNKLQLVNLVRQACSLDLCHEISAELIGSIVRTSCRLFEANLARRYANHGISVRLCQRKMCVVLMSVAVQVPGLSLLWKLGIWIDAASSECISCSRKISKALSQGRQGRRRAIWWWCECCGGRGQGSDGLRRRRALNWLRSKRKS